MLAYQSMLLNISLTRHLSHSLLPAANILLGLNLTHVPDLTGRLDDSCFLCKWPFNFVYCELALESFLCQLPGS